MYYSIDDKHLLEYYTLEQINEYKKQKKEIILTLENSDYLDKNKYSNQALMWAKAYFLEKNDSKANDL